MITNIFLSTLTYISSSRNIVTVYVFRQHSYEMIPLRVLLHNSLYVRVRQRTLNLVSNKILILYPHISFNDKGLKFFKNLCVRFASL